MARRRSGRRRHRGHGSAKLPIISLAILGAQVADAYFGGGDTYQRLSRFTSFYTGFSPSEGAFVPQRLIVGYAPWLLKRFLLPIARPRVSGMHLPISLS